MSGRVGSGQEASKISRVGSGRVGSGQVARCSKSHGSRRVRSVGWGREVSKFTECLAQQLYWPATSSRIVYSSVPPVCQYHPVLYPRGIATHEINQTRVCR